jgi:hypothetical protein
VCGGRWAIRVSSIRLGLERAFFWPANSGSDQIGCRIPSMEDRSWFVVVAGSAAVARL